MCPFIISLIFILSPSELKTSQLLKKMQLRQVLFTTFMIIFMFFILSISHKYKENRRVYLYLQNIVYLINKKSELKYELDDYDSLFLDKRCLYINKNAEKIRAVSKGKDDIIASELNKILKNVNIKENMPNSIKKEGTHFYLIIINNKNKK